MLQGRPLGYARDDKICQVVRTAPGLSGRQALYAVCQGYNQLKGES